jgi:hypothetical protein
MDLDEPADVYWPEDLSPNVVRGAHKKSCETVAEAVRYVMEMLPDPFREFAYIAAPNKHLEYREIPRSTRAPNTRISKAERGPSCVRQRRLGHHGDRSRGFRGSVFARALNANPAGLRPPTAE